MNPNTLQEQIKIGFYLLNLYRKESEKAVAHAETQFIQEYRNLMNEEPQPIDEIDLFYGNFRQYLRYAQVASLVSNIETRLADLCDSLSAALPEDEHYRETKNTKKGKKRGTFTFLSSVWNCILHRRREKRGNLRREKRGTLENCKNFLKKRVLAKPGEKDLLTAQWSSVETMWCTFTFLNRVRNCILHSGGKIGGMSNQKTKNALRKVGKNWKGYSVKQDTITLQDEFCRLAIEQSEQVFRDLLDLVPVKDP